MNPCPCGAPPGTSSNLLEYGLKKINRWLHGTTEFHLNAMIFHLIACLIGSNLHVRWVISQTCDQNLLFRRFSNSCSLGWRYAPALSLLRADFLKNPALEAVGVLLWDRWKRIRIQGQLVRNFIGRQEARAVFTESACDLFQLNHRIGGRFGG